MYCASKNQAINCPTQQFPEQFFRTSAQHLCLTRVASTWPHVSPDPGGQRRIAQRCRTRLVITQRRPPLLAARPSLVAPVIARRSAACCGPNVPPRHQTARPDTRAAFAGAAATATAHGQERLCMADVLRRAAGSPLPPRNGTSRTDAVAVRSRRRRPRGAVPLRRRRARSSPLSAFHDLLSRRGSGERLAAVSCAASPSHVPPAAASGNQPATFSAQRLTSYPALIPPTSPTASGRSGEGGQCRRCMPDEVVVASCFVDLLRTTSGMRASTVGSTPTRLPGETALVIISSTPRQQCSEIYGLCSCEGVER